MMGRGKRKDGSSSEERIWEVKEELKPLVGSGEGGGGERLWKEKEEGNGSSLRVGRCGRKGSEG